MLKQMLGDMTVASFLDRHLHRVPYTSRGGAADLAGRLTWETVEALVAAEPAADVLTARAGRLGENAPGTGAEARRLHDDGWTVAVRHAERHDDGLGALARELERDFAAAVDVHVYATPASEEGFAWHYDVEDVFIVVTAGRKRFKLRRNTVHPWPVLETMGPDLRYEQEVSPILECELGPGDWVYVPPGWWHVGAAVEDSLSLALGVMSPTALDLLDAARGLLAHSIVWRQRLPVTGELAGDGALDPALWRPLLDELGADLARTLTPDVVAELLAARRKTRKP